MVEYATLYLIKNKDENIKQKYLITVRKNREQLSIRDYTYSRTRLNIKFDEIDNYELILYKNVKYGSGYELKMIQNYYKRELGIE
jgi:sRNA-binding regulator protein Hfq